MKFGMLFWIIVSIALGVAGGMLFPEQMMSVEWIGTVFMNLLKLIVLPLVFSALVSSIGSMGDFRKLGSIGGYTLGYILLSVSIAVLIGLVLINTFEPGMGVDPSIIPMSDEVNETREPLTFSSFMLAMFPSNIVKAAANFEMMAIVIFSVIFSIGCLTAGEEAKPVIAFFVGLRKIFIKMIIWLMYLTPVGLFSLLGTAIAQAVRQDRLVESVLGVFLFIVMFLIGLLLQVAWQFGLVGLLTKRSPLKFLKATTGALATAFATSSSMATLPMAMIVAQEQGIRDEVSRFVLPFGTTINLAGTAMYEAVSALFFCQILGFDLSILSQIGVFITAILAGMGAAGMPEGGLVTMVMVLRSVNVPTSAIGLLLPFDRILDRFRTMTNVWGDLVCAATVDHLQRRKK